MLSRDKGWKVVFAALPKLIRGPQAPLVLAAISVAAVGYGGYVLTRMVLESSKS